MKPDLDKIFEKALQNGVNQKDLRRIAKIKTLKNGYLAVKYDQQPFNIKYTLLVLSLVVGLFAAGLPNEAFHEPLTYLRDLFAAHVVDLSGNCLLSSQTSLTLELFRPVDSCDGCRNVTKVCVRLLILLILLIVI